MEFARSKPCAKPIQNKTYFRVYILLAIVDLYGITCLCETGKRKREKKMKLTILEAEKTGTLGNKKSLAKMPYGTFGLSETDCKTGAKLAKVKGTVCSVCYNMVGHAQYPTAKQGYVTRLAGIDSPDWVRNQVFLIQKRYDKVDENDRAHRWFDNGDIQSLKMLVKMVAIANLTPDVKHWVPTKEYRIVLQYLRKRGNFPSNMTVRISEPLIRGVKSDDAYVLQCQKDFETLRDKYGLPTSGVSFDLDIVTCPSYNQGGKCRDCRECWGQNEVVYKGHGVLATSLQKKLDL